MLESHSRSIHSRLDTTLHAARAGLLVPLVLGALSLSCPVNGEVVSDFTTAHWEWTSGNSQAVTFTVADDQLKIGAQFTQPTNLRDFANTFADIGWYAALPLVPGRTLEMRVDLISVSHDDVFTFLSWSSNWQPGQGYTLFADKNEFGLTKFHQNTASYSVAIWESIPPIQSPITLVLGLTPTGEGGQSLLITITVLNRGTGAVLHHRRYLDTPQADPVLPSPGPHGFHFLAPEPGPAYTSGGHMPWLGIVHVTDGQQPPVELILDNLEYAYVPALAIENAVLLTWPTSQAQFEVWGARTVDGTWEKLTEPVFEFNERRQMTVPVPLAETMKIFRLQQVTNP